MAEIKNLTSPSQIVGEAKPAGKSQKNSSVNGSGFSKLYESMQADRKTASELEGGADGLEKAKAQLEQAMDFTMKIMVAEAKMAAWPGDEDSGSSKQMTDSARSVAEMMTAKAGVEAQIANAKLQKNPPIDLMSLKGQQVEYDDSTRGFYGEPVSYNYRISHSESSPSANVNLTIKIIDQNGVTVKTVRQNTKSGENTYEWDGTNNQGQLVLPGNYNIQLEAEGRKTVNGVSTAFPVQASATLIGTVEGLKIENGSAVGVVINGKVISRDNITDVRDVQTDENPVAVTPDLIGRKVELDYSRIKVSKDGNTEVYFNNHVENAGVLTVKVSKNGKHVTTLESKDNIDFGPGKVQFLDIGIEEGIYDIQLSVEDNSDPENSKSVKLRDNDTVVVGGISSRDGTIISTDNKIYSAFHIDAVVGNYMTSIEQRRADLVGSDIVYRSDLFNYSGNDSDISFGLRLPQEEAVIAYGRMNIYDEESGELIRSVRAEYDLNKLLDTDSSNAIKGYLNANFGTNDYNNVVGDERIEANQYIKNEIANGSLKIADPFRDSYQKGIVEIDFPKWDGLDLNNNKVDQNRQLRRDFTPVYSRDSDGELFVGETDRPVTIAKVDFVDQVGDELEIHVVGGGVIPEKYILSSKKD